jgi:DNA-directed RNA polymerase subunit RPC12/RpoP
MSNQPKKKKNKNKGSKLLYEVYRSFTYRAKNIEFPVKAGDEHEYICSTCGQRQIVVAKDDGAFPSKITCTNCRSDASSYGDLVENNRTGVVVRNLIRPNFQQFAKLPKGLQNLVLNGLLVFEDEVQDISNKITKTFTV